MHFCHLIVNYQAEKSANQPFMIFAFSYMTHRCPCSVSHPALIQFSKRVTHFKNKTEKKNINSL